MYDYNWKRTFLGYSLGAALALLSGCGGNTSTPYDAGADGGDVDTDTDSDTDTDTDVDTDSDSDTDTDTDTDTDVPPTLDSFVANSGHVGEELLIIETSNAIDVYVDIDPTDGASDDADITCVLSGSSYAGVFNTPGFYRTLTAHVENESGSDSDVLNFPDMSPFDVFDLYVDTHGRDEGEALGVDDKVDQYVLSLSDWQNYIKPDLSTAGITSGKITQVDDYESNLGTKTVDNVLVTKTLSGGKLIYEVSNSGYFGLDGTGLVFESVDLSTAEVDGLIDFIENN